MTREEEIRLIAYSLWVREGYPHGRAVEHWLRAEAIWEKVHTGKTASGIFTAIQEEAEEDDLSYSPSF
ncbi:MAG: DUF2934 domain-containing protein [Dehalococcoidales bacterium]|nr:DUF2934 domain-containing protein [Dehalococcoidales bacterium]